MDQETDYDPTQDLEHLHDLAIDKYEKRTRGVSQTTHDVFTQMANAHTKRLSVPRTKSFSRKEVMQAFADSFELIGGIPRLAAWAHENPTKFYELYSKLFPSESKNQMTHDGTLKIVAAIQPGPLDDSAGIVPLDQDTRPPIDVTPQQVEHKEPASSEVTESILEAGSVPRGSDS